MTIEHSARVLAALARAVQAGTRIEIAVEAGHVTCVAHVPGGPRLAVTRADLVDALAQVLQIVELSR